MSREALGLLVLDKPEGPTSHDAVAHVRRALGVRRVGHAGTLDPPASGVLLVGVGRATRLLRFLQHTDKRYEGTLELGATTTTLDRMGEVTATFDMSDVTNRDVVAAASGLTGELDQLPPMVSAVHHEGRRLHELAREGIEVDRTARRVRVASFDVHPAGASRYAFAVRCSSGTYVRSLVDDLGRALGGGAHLVSLRRTHVGRFGVDDAISLGAPAESLRGALRPPLDMVAHLGRAVLSPTEAAAFAHGRRVVADGALEQGAELAVLGHDGELLGVARVDGVALRPEVVMTQGASGGDG